MQRPATGTHSSLAYWPCTAIALGWVVAGRHAEEVIAAVNNTQSGWAAVGRQLAYDEALAHRGSLPAYLNNDRRESKTQ